MPSIFRKDFAEKNNNIFGKEAGVFNKLIKINMVAWLYLLNEEVYILKCR